MADWLAQPGITLFTENFDACVRFYRDTLGLGVRFDKGHLIALAFGDGYLLIENGGAAVAGGKTRAQNPTILRLNVEDVDAVATMLRGRGVAVDVSTHDWGTIGAFIDPDGNRCELRNQSREFTMMAS